MVSTFQLLRVEEGKKERNGANLGKKINGSGAAEGERHAAKGDVLEPSVLALKLEFY